MHHLIYIDNYYIKMLKCNEDSFSESEEEDVILLERSLVIESRVEVDHLIC